MKRNIKFWYNKHIKKNYINSEKNYDLTINTDLFNSGDNMHIAICDDEEVYLDLLLSYIKKSMASIDEDFSDANIDTHLSGELLLSAYSQGQHYDLIFLDIKMKELNGFDTAKNLRDTDSNAVIIFVTSMADYVFNSFEYRPFWFLIKPIDEVKFRHVFSKALAEIKNRKKGEYSFYARECGLVSMEVNNILYLESVLRKIVINTSTRQCSFYGGLTTEEEKLCKYDFIRIHKGFLVNMAHIQRINKTNVVLKSGVVLPLSEHRFKAVFDSFTSYLARC